MGTAGHDEACPSDGEFRMVRRRLRNTPRPSWTDAGDGRALPETRPSSWCGGTASGCPLTDRRLSPDAWRVPARRARPAGTPIICAVHRVLPLDTVDHSAGLLERAPGRARRAPARASRTPLER